MTKSPASAALLILASLTAAGRANADGAVATFHSVGITWAPSGGGTSQVAKVQFRPQGSAGAYRRGLDLWFDARDGEYRGSIVGLVPGTAYEIQLELAGTSTKTTMNATTWSETPPIAKTITLPPNSSKMLDITESGSPSGYVVYAAAPGQSATIDVDNQADYDIAVHASYVIVRGLTLRNAARHGIRIFEGSHDVIIEDNDISGWGSLRDAQNGWGENEESAVFIANGPTVDRVVIQRNKMHDPRWDTNSWSFGHPEGPQGVTFESGGGNHVIRYNEIIGSETKHWQDCIGGGENFSNEGFPNRDSDIYGNICTYAWDDAIELEGGNRNVRAWGNFMDYTATGIASATTGVGPLYVFRNVYLHSRKLSELALDQDDRGPFAKVGDAGGYGGGRRYFFHNTMLQPPPSSGATYSLGGGAGIGDDGGPITNTVSRNNVWQNFKDWHASIQDTRRNASNDFDYDLTNGPIQAYSGAEAHGLKGVPVFAPGHGAASGAGGNYALSASSPGFDQAIAIPNFNDDFTGAAPDMGAHESGAPPLSFGLKAATTGNAANPGTPMPNDPGGASGSSTGAALDGGASAGTEGDAKRSATSRANREQEESSGCSVTRSPRPAPAAALFVLASFALFRLRRRAAFEGLKSSRPLPSLLPACQGSHERAPRANSSSECRARTTSLPPRAQRCRPRTTLSQR